MTTAPPTRGPDPRQRWSQRLAGLPAVLLACFERGTTDLAWANDSFHALAAGLAEPVHLGFEQPRLGQWLARDDGFRGVRHAGGLTFAVSPSKSLALQGEVIAEDDGLWVVASLGPAALDQLASSLIELNSALQDSQRDTARASRAKSVFLASMSHEIRTPLNAVLGYAQLLQRDPRLDDEQRAMAATINSSGEHLLALVNDVLDLARIEAGRMELEPVDMDPAEVLGEVAALFEARASERGLELRVAHEGLPKRVRMDARRLRQVLINLVGNALKFTRQGHITLRGWPVGEHAQGWWLGFSVADTGSGIDETDRLRIFEAFGQAEAGRSAGGAGLGLAISSRIVGLMGGHIELDSRPGLGSRFHFQARAHRPEDATGAEAAGAVPSPAQPGTPTRAPASASRGARVLVADDHAENRGLLRRVLGGWGLEVVEARDGAEAVALARAERPAAVLLDVVMPQLGGVEATRQLLASPGLAGLPVIALTASATDEEVRAIRRAGARAVLAKPVRLDELAQALAAEAGLRVEHAQAPLPVGAHAPAPPGAAAPPPDWRTLAAAQQRRLRQAAEIGDVAALRAQAAALRGSHAALAQALEWHLARYDLEGLLQTLRPEDPPAPR